MVAPLLTGLGKALGGNATKQVARKTVKKISKDKVKSAAKNKKNNKISKDSSVLSTNSIGDIETKLYNKESTLDSSQKLKTPTLKIKSISKTDSPIEQLKLNVTNIHNFLVQQNKQKNKLKRENQRRILEEISKQKKKLKEKKIESPINKSIKNIKESTSNKNQGSILDNLLEFIELIIGGIVVNALPAIISKVKEIIDSVVNFLTPIQSGFNLIMGFFNGELDQKEYDVDRKRIDDALASFEADGGLVDQFAEKMGPLGALVKQLKPFIGMVRKEVKGKNITLAIVGGKEGVLNTETKEFIAKEWTSAERERMGVKGSSSAGASNLNPTDISSHSGDTVTSRGGTTANEVSGFPITSHFGQRWGRLHGGIDVGTPTGTPLALAHAGKIMYAGLNGGYGNMIDAWVPHLNVQFRFAHLVKLFKKTGDNFKANEILGKTGGGAGDPGRGSSTGSHLHYEIDTQKNGTTYGGSKNKDLLYDMAKHVILGSSSSSSNGEGGTIIPQIRGNMPSDEVVGRISHSAISDQNVSTYYYIQPYDTIQNQVVPFPVSVKKTSSITKQSELNSIWTK
jgi:murein DD-endopeptidase MepM/ murein hydrolase activator NlpD